MFRVNAGAAAVRRLVDDAAVFPPAAPPLPDAVAAHREHRAAWYADLVGPLLVPGVRAAELIADADPVGRRTGRSDRLIVAPGWAAVPTALSTRGRSRQVEAAVAKRGEDPQPGLAELRGWPSALGRTAVYAEIPLTWGLLARPGHGRRGPGGRHADRAEVPDRRAGRRAVPHPGRAGRGDLRLPRPGPAVQAGRRAAPRDAAHRPGDRLHPPRLPQRAGRAPWPPPTAPRWPRSPRCWPRPSRCRWSSRSGARRDEPRPLWSGSARAASCEPLTDLVRLGLVNGG